VTFVGDTPLSARLAGHQDLRRWFERFARLLPEPRFEIQRLLIGGPPWRQQVTAHVLIHSNINGKPYQNQFAHLLTLRWGKAVDDLVLEDTQTWKQACQRLVDAGVTEPADRPLIPTAR
jgi:ketosteroid isomerase-like protein